MGFKRKRSLDESPLSVSSWTSSTPEAQSPTPIPPDPSNAMEMDLDDSSPPSIHAFFPSHPTRVRSDAHSRTRKRHRDNRPSERTIHESTIHKLFSAQRNLPPAEPIPTSPQLQPLQSSQKSTLHTFWNISTPAPAPPLQHPQAIQIHHDQLAPHTWDAPRCEDCDASLHAEDSGAMDVDGGIGSAFACRECGKRVCGTCAVVGRARCCLGCAMMAGGRAGRWW
ncbi:hypothetical protein EJ04DRAFT_576026 [Polyplosphaeria fusca]|uniref:Uncharacterized protein n=1 Tax=Polyplosphaeria fusca TaxID=682080 RepID=A0A9P4R1X4_9PLEO|nr:hypothetical protein EJ04DRAFT_576026 [Polyplosphaeria fusca]